MRKLGIALLMLPMLLAAQSVAAADNRLKFSLTDAMGSENAKAKLDGSVKFYFGKQKHANPAGHFGTFTSNKKTNSFNKTEKEACEWAFLSAIIALQERAQREGGNAVINIHSVYRNAEFVSETEYECGVGAVVAGVAMRGDVVKLP